MKVLLMFCLCVCCFSNVNAEDTAAHDYIRKWNFPNTRIDLFETTSQLDGKIIYALDFMQSFRPPTNITEEVGFLKTVTQDMEKAGMPPQRITSINLSVAEPNVLKQLATAAYDSPLWAKKFDATNPGGALALILNQIGAYAPFNQVFNPYGLQVKVNYAGKIGLVKPQEFGLAKKGKLRLPNDATLEISLIPVEP
jgi:hypothetical protein